MEKIKNHSGNDSVRVFRPADADEATVCWKMAVENMDTPTALIFSRQNVMSLPEGTDYEGARKGAYIVEGSDADYDVILLASGSEVATLVAGSKLLREDGIKTRIVSVPSEGLFRTQPKDYQESILPTGAKIFGMTAGLPVTLAGLVGANGMVFGLNTFGFSAPYKVLDEKLGFTAENVYNQVKHFLKGGSKNYHRIILSFKEDGVLSSFGLFSVQSVSSLSRNARITPSFTCALSSKIVSK